MRCHQAMVTCYAPKVKAPWEAVKSVGVFTARTVKDDCRNELDGTLAQSCKEEELGGCELDWGAEVCRELSDGGEERGLSSLIVGGARIQAEQRASRRAHVARHGPIRERRPQSSWAAPTKALLPSDFGSES